MITTLIDQNEKLDLSQDSKKKKTKTPPHVRFPKSYATSKFVPNAPFCCSLDQMWKKEAFITSTCPCNPTRTPLHGMQSARPGVIYLIVFHVTQADDAHDDQDDHDETAQARCNSLELRSVGMNGLLFTSASFFLFR